MAVETVTVGEDEAPCRLDRWFLNRYPKLTNGQLRKLLRTGQVRVDGKRVEGGHRLQAGEAVRVPPLPAPPENAPADKPAPAIDVHAADDLRARVIARERDFLALDKPAGLAVQGGSKTATHVDGLLPALAEGDETLRLVHRLDRDTSGVLVVARTAAAARALTEAFRRHAIDKTYLALLVGKPAIPVGEIKLRLDKRPGAVEKMAPSEDGPRAVTRYAVLASAGKVASLVAMKPLTGRTHQLRVHAAEGLGCPILGDGKYGGAAAKRAEAPSGLMLHAWRLVLPGRNRPLTAPPPARLRAAMAAYGFGIDLLHGIDDLLPAEG